MLRRNLFTTGAFVIRRDVFSTSAAMIGRCARPEDWEFYLRLTAGHLAAFSEGPPVVAIFGHGGNMSSDNERMEQGFVTALVRVLQNAR